MSSFALVLFTSHCEDPPQSADGRGVGVDEAISLLFLFWDCHNPVSTGFRNDETKCETWLKI